MATKFGLAQPVRRVEDPRLLKGDGRYTDDIALPGMLWGAVLRSPHAAAKLGAIDTAEALASRASSPSTPGPTWRRTASAACPAPSR